MTDREEAIRIVEDIYRIEDEIEFYNEIIRTKSWDEDNADEDTVEQYINTLENEKSYLQAVWDSDFEYKYDWDELSNYA